MLRNYSDISNRGKKIGTGILFVLMAAAFPFCGHAQDMPAIKWSTDTTKIRIGEQIKLNIEVRAKKNDEVSFPDMQFASDSMEVVGMSDIDTSYKKDDAVYKVTYSLTSFDKGKYRVPAVEIKAGDQILATDPFTVDVATVEVDTLKQARYSIKDIRPEPYTAGEIWKKYYWVLIVLAVLALLIWETVRLARRRKEAKIPPEMLLSPYERAKFRLNRLDEEHLVQKGRIKDFYVALTDVIRLYLDEQYGLPAPESTSDEILKDVRKLKLSKEEYSKLRDLLMDSDLVKFAKMYPSDADNERYRLYTENIIDTLRPEEEEEKTDEEPGGKQAKQKGKNDDGE